jgi:hypothetical protein
MPDEPSSQSQLESTLTAFSRRLGDLPQRRQGSILLRFTDSGEEYLLETTGRESRVGAVAVSTTPLVSVSGTSAVLAAIMDGRQEPRRAFMAGGIRVQGDLPYLENLLRELGLLDCG